MRQTRFLFAIRSAVLPPSPSFYFFPLPSPHRFTVVTSVPSDYSISICCTEKTARLSLLSSCHRTPTFLLHPLCLSLFLPLHTYTLSISLTLSLSLSFFFFFCRPKHSRQYVIMVLSFFLPFSVKPLKRCYYIFRSFVPLSLSLSLSFSLSL